MKEVINNLKVGGLAIGCTSMWLNSVTGAIIGAVIMIIGLGLSFYDEVIKP